VVAVAFIRGAQLGFLGTGTVHVFGRFQLNTSTLAIVSVVAVIALAAAWVWDDKRAAREAAAQVAPPEEIDPFEGGYPVPPLPGQRLREPGAPALVGSAAPAVISTTSSSNPVKEETHG
jgi:NADH-quinone oxidoreductase subunit H